MLATEGLELEFKAMLNAIRDLPRQNADFDRGARIHTDELNSAELFDLMSLAELSGYNVQSAHSPEARNHPILTDIYAVWFAIKHQIPVFEHNIPALVEYIIWKYSPKRSGLRLVPIELMH